MRDVNGYEGLYKIAVDGVVCNIKGNVVKQRITAKGYSIINLRKKGISSTHRVHRLVASAYIDGEDVGLQVDHIDGDKQNNSAANLRWCTASENMGYYYGYSLLDSAKVVMTREELEASYVERGRSIIINGEVYRSISNAAKYIAGMEGKKVDTIKKELKNFMNGKRASWKMYNKYYIGK